VREKKRATQAAGCSGQEPTAFSGSIQEPVAAAAAVQRDDALNHKDSLLSRQLDTEKQYIPEVFRGGVQRWLCVSRRRSRLSSGWQFLIFLGPLPKKQVF
jgi:hypothetical protein